MCRSPRQGFTLIDLLVALAIVAVLIAFLLPATRSVREPAARMKCRNNLKELMLAMQQFEATGGPTLYPPAGSPDAPADRRFPAGCLGPGAAPEERLSWAVSLLPYLEQADLSRQFDPAKGVAGNLPAARTRVGLFLCPSAKDAAAGDAVTHYVALAGIGHEAAARPAGAPGNGFMGYDRRTSMKMIEDGTSNTIALMETRAGVGPWARGGPSTTRGFDPADESPFGGHPGGMTAAMADGSVRFVRSSIDPRELAAAITIAGGEEVHLD